MFRWKRFYFETFQAFDFNLYLLIFFHLILALSFDMSFDLSIPIRRENSIFGWIMHKENRRESSQKSHDIYYWVVKRQRICWQNLSLIWFGNENNDNEENCALMRSALFIFGYWNPLEEWLEAWCLYELWDGLAYFSFVFPSSHIIRSD